jgi:hypothetical protein
LKPQKSKHLEKQTEQAYKESQSLSYKSPSHEAFVASNKLNKLIEEKRYKAIKAHPTSGKHCKHH